MAARQTGKPRSPRGARSEPVGWSELLRRIGEEYVARSPARSPAGGPAGVPAGGPAERPAMHEQSLHEQSLHEQLARLLWSRALEGDVAAIKLLAAYAHGAPVQPVAVTAHRPFTADEYGRASARLLAWRAARLGDAAEDGRPR